MSRNRKKRMLWKDWTRNALNFKRMNRDLKEDQFTEGIGRQLKIHMIRRRFSQELKKQQQVLGKELQLVWINKKRETSLNFINKRWAMLIQIFREIMKKLTTLKNY